MSSPKENHFDAVYPEPLSRLRRGHGLIGHPLGVGMGGLAPSAEAGPTAASYRRAVKKQRLNRGAAGRFRTQPVTFQEIKEVDEENVPELEVDLGESLGTRSVAAGVASRSESDLKARFELFYRSINEGVGAGGNNNEGGSGIVRSPPIAISFPVCPVHSGGASMPSPMCQATCFPTGNSKDTGTGTGTRILEPTAAPATTTAITPPLSKNSEGVSASTSSAPNTTTPPPPPPPPVTTSPLMANIAVIGARSRQSF